MDNEETVQQRRCSVEGCAGGGFCRGYCSNHYNRWKTHGDPNITRLPRVSFSRPEELKASLRSRVSITKRGCWEWQLCRDEKGYGTVSVDGKPYGAHRVSATVHSGFDINSPFLICHSCDYPPCINPDHLFPGTGADNSADMVAKKRSAKGEQNGSSKLSEGDVRDIRRRLAAGETQTAIAEVFGVHQTLIGFIARGVRWRHVR